MKTSDLRLDFSSLNYRQNEITFLLSAPNATAEFSYMLAFYSKDSLELAFPQD